VALPAGTKILRSEWVVVNTFPPNGDGGVALSKVMPVRAVQPANAQAPMVVTLLGITILVKAVQFQNAEESMVVTLLGKTMPAKAVRI